MILRNLADFATKIHFDREKPEHATAPIVPVHAVEMQCATIHQWFVFVYYACKHFYGQNH